MIQLKRIGKHDLPLPKQSTHGAAGFDLASAVDHMLTLYPGQILTVPTGFAWAIPLGMVGMIRPRSGLAVRNGIDILAGVIDADFRGEVCVVMVNHGEKPLLIKHGDRIAQMVVQECYMGAVSESETLPSTDRGDGGFGSTGA